MDRSSIDIIRRFNRAHTRRVGALDESFLASGRPLGQSRLLWEIGSTGTGAQQLRGRLGLDAGYLSRLLATLEHDGLITTQPDPVDRRRRVVLLTPAGRSAWEHLDRRSDEFAASLLEPLSERQRAELTDAIATADRLLGLATIEYSVIDPRSRDATTALTAYFDELETRFDDGFEPGETLDADARAMTAPTGAFLVARSDIAVVACGGIQRHDERTGEIKRMWVHPDWRGLGLGRRTLSRLETEVVALGYSAVVLDTNDVLTEAIAMYGRAGYESIERYNDNPYAHCWFRKQLH